MQLKQLVEKKDDRIKELEEALKKQNALMEAIKNENAEKIRGCIYFKFVLLNDDWLDNDMETTLMAKEFELIRIREELSIRTEELKVHEEQTKQKSI